MQDKIWVNIAYNNMDVLKDKCVKSKIILSFKLKKEKYLSSTFWVIHYILYLNALTTSNEYTFLMD